MTQTKNKRPAKRKPNGRAKSQSGEKRAMDASAGQITILAMDLSLNGPGLAVLKVSKDGGLELAAVGSADFHNTKMSAAEKIELIRQFVGKTIELQTPTLFVMERGFSRFPKTTQNLFRVVGVVENEVFRRTGQLVDTIPPKAVKKLVALDGRSDKDAVADALKPYVGDRCYHNDNESDAVAVGVAYAMLKGWVHQITPDEKAA